MIITRQKLRRLIRESVLDPESINLQEMTDMPTSSNIYGRLDDRLAQYQNKSSADFVIEAFDEVGLPPINQPGQLKDFLVGYGVEDGVDGMPMGLLNTMSASETAEGIYRGLAKAILFYLKKGQLGFAKDPFVGPVINPQTYERAPMSDDQKLTILMHHLAKYIGDNVTFSGQ